MLPTGGIRGYVCTNLRRKMSEGQRENRAFIDWNLEEEGMGLGEWRRIAQSQEVRYRCIWG